MKSIKFIPFVCLCIFSSVNGYCHENARELLECETLSFSASVANSTQDIASLSYEAVLTCYNAYRSSYDRAASIAKEKYARSSALPLAIIDSAKTFANQIIVQIDVLAKQLTSQQKQQFWILTEGNIKSTLNGFCSGHGCPSTGDLNEYITNQINLKKKFG